MNLFQALGLVCGAVYILTTASTHAATWSVPRALNPTATSDGRDDNSSPAIATDGKDNWVGVWGSNPVGALDYETYSARSFNNGTTWTGLTPVNSDAPITADGQDITSHLATDTSGTWIAAWMKNSGLDTGSDDDIFYARSTNNGTTWSQIGAIDSGFTTDTRIDMYPHIAADGKGTFVALWGSVDGATGRYYMKSARSHDSGITWEKAVHVSPYDIYNRHTINTCFKIATNRQGQWIAIAHSDNLTSPSTGVDLDIVGFRSTDNGATWSAPFVINSDATTDGLVQSYPYIASDGNKTWVAAWSNQLATGVASINISRSTDNGLTWSPSRNISSTASPQDTNPVIETDEHGSWIIAWANRKIATPARVEYAESRDNGATWASGGLIANYRHDEVHEATPQVKSDRRGRWIAAWPSRSSLPSGGGGDTEIVYSIAEFGNINVDISSRTLDFGTHQFDSGASATLELNLANTGIGPILFDTNGIQITGPSSNAFAFTEPPSLDPLPQDGTRVLRISFDPTNIGAHLALLRLYTNAPESPIFIDLQGYGSSAPSSVNDWSIY